ncbi:hypothetical protein [Halobacillus litoralis]|uniref:hypothetical protein n=1 Tax=Halobacillus litoralis TaxID=45668 RepID=UPI001CD7B43C|nr:hypothetical protein [Halobacillus litoralis]MCA1021491.1 hypothetical protein [Halobacillus litoralis]
MSLFFIVIMIGVYIYSIVNGKLFPQTMYDLTNYQIHKQQGKHYPNEEELGIRSIGMIITYTIIAIIDIALVCVGIAIDPHLFPSLIALGSLIISFIIGVVVGNKNKIENFDFNNEYEVDKVLSKAKKKHIWSHKLICFLWLLYLAYLAALMIG